MHHHREGAVNGSYTGVILTTSDQIVLPQSGHRKVIIISANSTAGFACLAFGKPASTSGDYGISVYGGQHVFRREDLGGLIDADLHMIATATIAVGIFVGYEP